MSQPLIGLLDCNNFFVSCERLFRPDLKGKPVVVLSSNDGCVVARSQEIKDMGIPMGVPYFQIKDILQKAGATTFSSNFTLYRDISRRVIETMRVELDTVEQYSIDEAFFTVVGNPEVTALRVKQAVERWVGIPVSVGIARSKTQAKYVNKLAKSGSGTALLNDELWQAQAPTVPIQSVWGIGKNLELSYKRHGLLTVADLMTADPARLERIFGVGGVRLQQELLGNPVFRVGQTRLKQQSLMSSRSFNKVTTDRGVIADALAYHVRQVVADLRAMEQQARQIRVLLRPSRHGAYVLRGGVTEAVLPVPSADTMAFLAVADELLEKLFEPGVPYQKTGVQLGMFSPTGARQQSLFHTEREEKSTALMSVIDHVNKRRGRDVILLGSHLREAVWQSKANNKSASYTTQWTELATVRAS